LISNIDELLHDETLKLLDEYSPSLRTHFRSTTDYGQMNAIAPGALI
jgi:hypothetical protein